MNGRYLCLTLPSRISKMKYTSSLATAFSIIGAFTVASGYGFIGYCAFVVGAAGWAYVGKVRRDNPLLILNLVFLAANCVGLYNNF